MADEIVIPLVLWNHRVNNANASWDQLTATTNAHMAAGIRCKDAETTDINWRLAYKIPADINGTPAATINIRWVTASADVANNVKFFVKCIDVTYNTTSVDPAVWDDELTVLDASNGAYVENSCYVDLTAATSVTSGKEIRGIIRREATDAQDLLGADVLITSAALIADKA
jgi:hypothetical protein